MPIMNCSDALNASRLEVRHLRYFLAVAEEEHFGRGARKVHVAQPAISRQIQQLEEELGVQLFQRKQRGVRLTHAGHWFRQRALAILENLRTAVEETRQINRGSTTSLRVGYVDMAFYSGAIPERIRRFREANPGVEINLIPATSAEQIDLLARDEIDLGLIYQPAPPQLRLATCRLCTEPVAVAVHQNSRLANRPTVALNELDQEPFVWFNRAQNPFFFDYVEQVCNTSGLRRKVIQDAANDPTQLTLVAAQVGITFSPISALRTKPETVQLIQLRAAPLKLTLYAAWQKRENANSPVDQLLQALRH
jgi:DNA-binding transcriptional LysR family regulator